MAILLCEATPSPQGYDPFSCPPPEEYAQFYYPEKDGDMTEEEYNSRLTIMGIHQIARRASLPLDTFILAALILKQLESVSQKFYKEWLYELRKPGLKGCRCKEVVVLSAIVLLPLICDQLIGRLLLKSFFTMQSTR